jgi:hypothetical protein
VKVERKQTADSGKQEWLEGSGFRVQGSGFRVQGSGFRVQEPPRSRDLFPEVVPEP